MFCKSNLRMKEVIAKMNEGIFELFPELSTKRLLLRQITHEDNKKLLEVLSDENTCKYLTHNAVNDISKINKLILGIQRFFEEKQRIRWGIAIKDQNNIIGHCGFFEIDNINSCAEISYCLKSEFWAKGFMTEALNEMLKFGFNNYGLNRIVAKVVEDNIGSIKTLEKLGFVKEGLSQKSFHKNDQSHDLIIYSLLKSEYYSID